MSYGKLYVKGDRGSVDWSNLSKYISFCTFRKLSKINILQTIIFIFASQNKTGIYIVLLTKSLS